MQSRDLFKYMRKYTCVYMLVCNHTLNLLRYALNFAQFAKQIVYFKDLNLLYQFKLN